MADKREITVAGITAEVRQPYDAGHTINEAEAKALNQTWAENIRNNTAKKVKDLASEDGSYTDKALAEARAIVAEYDASYEFTLATVGSSKTLTPLEKECLAEARKVVADKLREAGTTAKAYKEKNGEDAVANLVAQVAEHPAIVELAKKNLKNREKLADVQI